MIEKNVILFVRGEQQFEQGEPEVTELMTEGAMTLAEDGEITLTYRPPGCPADRQDGW